MASLAPIDKQTSRSTSAQLSDLPDELLQSILAFLSIQDLSSSDSVNKRFNGLVRSLTEYSSHCAEQFRFWHPKHRFHERLRAPVAETDWRNLLMVRVATEKYLKATFEDIIQTQAGRYNRIDTIATHGPDAKDFLLRELDTPEDAEDHLARTYWAQIVLGQIERRMAFETLLAPRKHDSGVRLERALACVDLCLISRAPETPDQVEEHLDRIAIAFTKYLHQHQESGQGKTPRDQATLLCTFLHGHKLVGLADEQHYHDLASTLISLALCNKEHESLPLVSVAIYCAVARRVGLEAYPVNYPLHIYVVVSPGAESNVNLDGDQIRQADDRSDVSQHQYFTYLDPYSGSTEISYDRLHTGLLGMHLAEAERRACLQPCKNITHMLVRTTRNLERANESTEMLYSDSLQEPDYQSGFIPPSVFDRNGQIHQVEIGGQAAITHTMNFMRVILARQPEVFGPQVTGAVMMAVVERFLTPQTVRDFILPLFSSTGPSRRSMEETLARLEVEDNSPRTPKRRTDIANISAEVQQHPVYTVGTYFKHKRYDYQGVIVGWDSRCNNSEAWISQNLVDELPRGRRQPFYNIIDWFGHIRYVAEENIVCMGRWQNETRDRRKSNAILIPNRMIMRKAGEYMKKWDPRSERFVSNLGHEYPDD